MSDTVELFATYGGYDPGLGAGITGAAVLVPLLVLAGLYVWMGVALTAVFRKAEVATWKAWVPVVNVWWLFVLARMRGGWSVVLAAGGFVVGAVSTILAVVLTGSAVAAAVRGETGGAVGTAVAAFLLPAVLCIGFGVFALVLHIRMIVGVGRGFGLGAGYAVLGVLLFPVWASVVGWGSAEWRGRAAGAEAPRAAVPPLPPLPPMPVFGTVPATAAAPVAPAAAVAAPWASSAPLPPAPAASTLSPPPAAAPPVAPAPPAPPLPPVAAPSVPSAWAPPPPPSSEPGMPGPRTEDPLPAAPAPISASPAAPPYPAPEQSAIDDEHTVLARPRRAQAVLFHPDGTTTPLTADTVVLGRRPDSPDGLSGAQTVSIPDVTKTVSKTHAILRRGTTGWSIEDLSSMNGTTVLDAADSESDVHGETPVVEWFYLGDVRLRLTDDGPTT